MSKQVSYAPHYTEADIAQCERIRGWLSGGTHSQADLARASGVKDGTLSPVINGQYPTSPAKWLLKLLDAINSRLERERSGWTEIPFCETSIYKAISRICRRAQSDVDIGVYYGEVGIGKTTALREYAKRSPGAIMVEAFEGIDNSTFVRMLVQATGTMVASSANLSAKVSAVIAVLQDQDRVILVDEADHLPNTSFGALRRISDIARVGVVMVGNKELLTRLTEATGQRKQVCDRVGFWPPIAERVTDADIRMMAEAYLGEDEALGDEVLNALKHCCKSRARPLKNLLRNTLRYARNNKVPITAALVKQMDSDTMAGLHAVRA